MSNELRGSSPDERFSVTENQALWHDNATQSSLRVVDSDCHDTTDLVAVRTLYSMVSTGTEKQVCCGAIDTEFADKMSVQHQQGEFSLPIKYGYSLVGYTQDRSSQEQHTPEKQAQEQPAQERQLVHLMHPHQRIAYAKSSDLFYLPEELKADSAALISNMETVVNGIWDAELFFDAATLRQQKIAVVGFGNIGALLALTLRKISGVKPVVIEANAWRRKKAESLGFTVYEPKGYSTQKVRQSANLLFHCTGSEAGLNFCLCSAELEGVIIDLSWYGARQINISLGREFHYQRLRLISSQVSHIPKHKASYDFISRKQYCVQLLLDPLYQAVISDRIPFEQSPDFFHKLRNNRMPDGLIWLFDYGSCEKEERFCQVQHCEEHRHEDQRHEDQPLSRSTL